MRIVHVMTRLLRAGSEENVLLTCKGQIEAGHAVYLVHGGDSSSVLVNKLTPELPLIEVADLVRPIAPMRDYAAYREMRRIFRQLKPDVVHTHQSKAGIVGRYAAQREGVPCIIHGVHILPFVGTSGISRLIYLYAERAATRMTHGFVHVSQGMKSGCLDNGIGEGVPHEIIPSGFDLNRFKHATPPEDWRSLLGLGPDEAKPFTVLMMAALEPRKRHLELLDTLRGLTKKHPEVRILFAGEGPLRDDVITKAEMLGMGRNVRLLGYRSDPERLIALSDVSILSSGQEGLPRCILQSVVGGRPTVAFALPGIEVAIRDTVNGFVVPMDDWCAFGLALERLAGDPELRSSMTAAADAADLSVWDWERMGPRTNEFYGEVMKYSRKLGHRAKEHAEPLVETRESETPEVFGRVQGAGGA